MPSTVTDRMLSGNDIAVFLSKQTAKGAIDASPAFLNYRRTEGAGTTTVNYTQSSIVKSNRQARPQIQERSEYNIPLSSELNKQAIDDLLSAIHSPAEEVVSITDIDFAAVADGFTGLGNFAGVAVGDYIFMAGFANAAIDGAYRIVTLTGADGVTTYPAPPAIEQADASVTMTMRKSVSAKSQTYYAVQTRTLDKSKVGEVDYHTLYDAIINTMSIDIPDSGIATYSVEMIAEAKNAGTAALTGQTDSAALTDDSVSAVQHITDFWINGVSEKCEIKSLSLEINNNYSQDAAAGCQGTRMAYGDLDVTGSIAVRSMTSSPFTWREYYENATDISIGVRITHSDGDDSIILIRSAKVTDHSMPNGSNVIANAECSFGAQEDATSATTIEVFRNWS